MSHNRFQRRDMDLIDLAQVIRGIESGESPGFKLESLPELTLPRLEQFILARIMKSSGNRLTAPGTTLRNMAMQLKRLSTEFAEEKGDYQTSRGTNAIKSRGKFPQFKKLPLELRRLIWSYALPGPQILEIYYPYKRAAQQASAFTQLLLIPFLKACSESRDAVTSSYCIENSCKLGCYTGRDESTLAFNPMQDIMYLTEAAIACSIMGRNSHMPDDAELGLRRFRAIAFDETDLKRWLSTNGSYITLKWLPRMKYLEKIMVVLNIEGQDDRDRVLHRGLPLQFAPAEDQHSHGDIRMAWTHQVNYHTEMESLLNVELEFVIPRRERPPHLLSVKLENLHHNVE